MTWLDTTKTRKQIVTNFLITTGNFHPLIQVDTLNINGSYNLHTATHWLHLC